MWQALSSDDCHWKKSWVPLSELYLFLFLTAAVSAALGLMMALCCRYAFPRVSTITSQVALRSEFHGSNVKPSGRLPSSRTSPCGSFMLGTPARVKARCDVVFIYLFTYWIRQRYGSTVQVRRFLRHSVEFVIKFWDTIRKLQLRQT